MRIATSLLLTVGLVASLAACSAPTPQGSGDCPPVASGSASDAVKVSGDFGTKPDVTVGSPATIKETQRTVTIAGDGDTVAAGDTVNVQFLMFNGSTGENLGGTEFTENSAAAFPMDEEQFLPGVVKTLECSTVGSRVVGVIPPADFAGVDPTGLGLTADDNLVFVADVVSIVVPPTPKPWTKDVPDVTWGDDGAPTVTLPDIAPPTDLMLAVLKKGDGDVVKSGDTVTVNYQGTSWDTGEIFDQSYGKSPATFATGGVVPGFGAALVGQKVGSTVIVVIPPELAYGTDPDDPNARGLGGQTLVFVLEIQAIAK